MTPAYASMVGTICARRGESRHDSLKLSRTARQESSVLATKPTRNNAAEGLGLEFISAMSDMSALPDVSARDAPRIVLVRWQHGNDRGDCLRNKPPAGEGTGGTRERNDIEHFGHSFQIASNPYSEAATSVTSSSSCFVNSSNTTCGSTSLAAPVSPGCCAVTKSRKGPAAASSLPVFRVDGATNAP